MAIALGAGVAVPAVRPEISAPARYAPATEPPPPPPAGQPMSLYAPGVAQPDDIPDDAVLPPGRAAPAYPRMQPAYNAPVYQPPPQRACRRSGRCAARTRRPRSCRRR